MAVFLPSRPCGTCFIKPSTRLLADSFSCCLVLGFASHVTRLCFSSWSAGCVLRRPLLMSGSSVTPILGFGSRVSLALVCFFPPDCEFLVVIVHLVLLSRCSVRDFSSGLFIQLHLVVVNSDVAFVWPLQHCCVVLCCDVVLHQCGSLPQLGLLTSRKLSAILCHCVVLDPHVSLFSWDAPTCVVQHHCVVLDPRVSLASLAEIVSLSLCFMCCAFRALQHEPLLSLLHVTSLHVCG